MLAGTQWIVVRLLDFAGQVFAAGELLVSCGGTLGIVRFKADDGGQILAWGPESAAWNEVPEVEPFVPNEWEGELELL